MILLAVGQKTLREFIQFNDYLNTFVICRILLVTHFPYCINA